LTDQTPSTPQPSEPTPPTVGQATSTGLDPQLAGLLCYILGIVTGVIFFLIEKTNPVVRFHAAQSIVVSLAMFALAIGLGIVSVISVILGAISWTLGSLFSLLMMLVWLGAFILWIVLMIKGYSGEKWKLPVVGDWAERLAGSS
jgi:uncharacterized membrane protein